MCYKQNVGLHLNVEFSDVVKVLKYYSEVIKTTMKAVS